VPEVFFHGRRRREIQNRKQKEIYKIFKAEIEIKKNPPLILWGDQ
jgi:hypothetical protein